MIFLTLAVVSALVASWLTYDAITDDPTPPSWAVAFFAWLAVAGNLALFVNSI